MHKTAYRNIIMAILYNFGGIYINFFDLKAILEKIVISVTT